jgi:glycosyltransferase involved in cell wall biosynthesis
MKTVLLVTFYFPPSQEIAARRTGGLAKYLPAYGWRVVVLTPRQPTSASGRFELLATDYEDKVRRWRRRLHLHDGDSVSVPQTASYVESPTMIQRLRKWAVLSVRDLLTYPDATWSWYRPAVQAGGRFLQEEGADAILSSYGPATSHIVASALAGASQLPWVADYRDPWSSNFYTSHGRLLRSLDKRLEDRVTRSATAFIGVSRALTEGIVRCRPGVRAFLVHNGYDPEERATDSEPLDRQFTIVHCGYCYGGRRNPRILFEAVSMLIGEGLMRRDDVRIDFYGLVDPSVDRMSHAYGLDGVVLQHGMVSRDEAIASERRAQVLVVILSSSADDVGTIPGKVFEYMAARRPIVAIGAVKGEIADLLALTRIGTQATSAREMRDWILAAYRDFVEYGHVTFNCDEDAIEQFSQLRMAKRVAEALDYACDSQVTGRSSMIRRVK